MILPGSIAGGFVAASLNRHCGDSARFWREILFARKARGITKARAGSVASPRDEGLRDSTIGSQPCHRRPVDVRTPGLPPRDGRGHLLFHMPPKEEMRLNHDPPRSPGRSRFQGLIERGPRGSGKPDFKLGMHRLVVGQAGHHPLAKLRHPVGSARPAAKHHQDGLLRGRRSPVGQGLAPPLSR